MKEKWTVGELKTHLEEFLPLGTSLEEHMKKNAAFVKEQNPFAPPGTNVPIFYFKHKSI